VQETLNLASYCKDSQSLIWTALDRHGARNSEPCVCSKLNMPPQKVKSKYIYIKKCITIAWSSHHMHACSLEKLTNTAHCSYRTAHRRSKAKSSDAKHLQIKPASDRWSGRHACTALFVSTRFTACMASYIRFLGKSLVRHLSEFLAVNTHRSMVVNTG
jgi:hypothetical protein